MKSAALVFGLSTLFIITAFTICPTQTWAKSFINKSSKGLAIKGYDPVAYFTIGKPIKGK